MTKEQALEKLRAQCSRAEYCSGQVAAKLKKWMTSPVKAGKPCPGIPLKESDIPEIIRSLESDKFIDDARFAGAFVKDKLRFNGWGRQKIMYKLRSLGISSAMITVALAEYYDASTGERTASDEVLHRLLEKKWKSLKKEELPENKRTKVIRFALGRGFEYERIVSCLRELV